MFICLCSDKDNIQYKLCKWRNTSTELFFTVVCQSFYNTESCWNVINHLLYWSHFVYKSIMDLILSTLSICFPISHL